MTRSVVKSVAALALALPLAACGSGTGEPSGSPGSADTDSASATTAEPDETQPDEGGTWLTADGDVLLTCHREGPFPASVVEQGVEIGPEDSAAVVAALAEIGEEAGIDAPGPLLESSAEDVRWRVLWRAEGPEGEEMGILLAEPDTSDFSLERDEYLSLGVHEGAWRVEGWGGGCRAQLALDATSEWAQIAWPEDATEQTGSSIEVVVSEIQCASARDPEPHLAAEPLVVETEEDVTVYWTTERVVGGATCPGNPWVERTVQLEADLGERTLLDGSTWPAEPVAPVDEW